MTKQERQNQVSKDQKANSRSTEPSISQKLFPTSQGSQKTKVEIDTKKKIIKKFPFTSKITSMSNSDNKNDQDLKDWKPTSLNYSKNGPSIIKEETLKKRNQIFNHFLSNLPKPKKKDTEPQSINLMSQNALKKGHKQIFIKPTEEQLKWDAEDEFLTKNIQTYVTKNIQEKVQKPSLQSLNIANEQVQDNEQLVEKIVWLNEQNKNRSTNIAEIISKTWEKQANLLVDDYDSDQNQGKKNKPLPKIGNHLFNKPKPK